VGKLADNLIELANELRSQAEEIKKGTEANPPSFKQIEKAFKRAKNILGNALKYIGYIGKNIR